MVLLPIRIQFWLGAIKIVRFLSSSIIMLKKSCSASFKEAQALPLFLFLLSLQFSKAEVRDLLLDGKRNRHVVMLLKRLTKS